MDDKVMEVSTPEQFKALAHPMRHRLLFTLGQRPATISQLAASLGIHKGNVAHHLKVLATAGLVVPAGTRRVRGGTEQYYQRAARGFSYSGPDANGATAAAFQAIAAEIATAEPDPFLVLRTIRLTREQAAHITEVLRDLSDTTEDAGDSQPRYGMLLGLYRPRQPDPADAHVQSRLESPMRIRAAVELAGKTATGITVPVEVVTALGSSKRPAVRVTINGYTYRTTIAPMGGQFKIPISAEVRSNAAIVANDVVNVDIELDTESRQVAIPADLATALDQRPEARRRFDALSNSNKQRHVLPIEAAKTPETRQRRIAKTVSDLSPAGE